MTGLEAINANDGWSIALLGVSIVFSALVILSLTISQLHKVLGMWDNRSVYLNKIKTSRRMEVPEEPDTCVFLPSGIQESARHFQLLVQHLGQPFALPKLLDYADRCGLTRPCSTLNNLIQTGAIVPTGDGYYTWNDKVVV